MPFYRASCCPCSGQLSHWLLINPPSPLPSVDPLLVLLIVLLRLIKVNPPLPLAHPLRVLLLLHLIEVDPPPPLPPALLLISYSSHANHDSIWSSLPHILSVYPLSPVPYT